LILAGRWKVSKDHAASRKTTAEELRVQFLKEFAKVWLHVNYRNLVI